MTTIEGLGGRHPLQRAFVEHGGAQCGICTPGMILAAVALGKNPTLDQMKTGLAGNLCRCTGYSAIYRSIRKRHAREPKCPRDYHEVTKVTKRHENQLGHSFLRALRVFVMKGKSRDLYRWLERYRIRPFEPRSLTDALKMLRDEGPLVPMAGCTDLYVALNYGTLEGARFLNLWRLDSLRTIELRGAMLSIGAMATPASAPGTIARDKEVAPREKPRLCHTQQEAHDIELHWRLHKHHAHPPAAPMSWWCSSGFQRATGRDRRLDVEFPSSSHG